jgi:hypothetical protein
MARVLTLLRGFFRDIRPLLEMGIGAFLAVLLAFAALNLAWIAANIGQTILIILILSACFSLYVIRHFFPMAYDMVEIAIGLFAIFGAMGRAPQSLTTRDRESAVGAACCGHVHHYSRLR